MPENVKTAPSADVDPQVAAERERLDRSRAALRAMREDTLALRAEGGTAWSTEVLNLALRARAAALVDHSDVPLFFGRLDYARPARRPIARRPLLRRAPARARRRRRPAGGRLAGAGLAARSTGPAARTRWASALRRRFGFSTAAS